MKKDTVQQLIALNKSFYEETARHFSDSRDYYWEGWERLLPLLQTHFNERKHLQVLDVGCGNGRFGRFLAEKLPHNEISYRGIDFSTKLLAHADDLSDYPSADAQYTAADITHSIPVAKHSFDLVVAFGLIHHLPSEQLRAQVMQELAAKKTEGGLLISTFWHFAERRRFQQKMLDPAVVDINPTHLGENDYILDWKRGTSAFRYCHQVTTEEIEKLTNATGCRVVQTFFADGKSGNGNKYLVLQ